MYRITSEQGERYAARLFAAATVVALLTAPQAFATTAAGSGAPATRIADIGNSIDIGSWLVAGPFPSADLLMRSPDGPRRTGFDTDFLVSVGGEAAARLTAGTKVVSPDGSETVFERRDWESSTYRDLPYIDLTKIFGRLSHACAYIYAELESAEERSVFLHVGADDAAKVWVGGELVLSHPRDGGASPAEHVVQATLAAGKTPVLMKIDQARGEWGAYVGVARTSFLSSDRDRRRSPRTRDDDRFDEGDGVSGGSGWVTTGGIALDFGKLNDHFEGMGMPGLDKQFLSFGGGGQLVIRDVVLGGEGGVLFNQSQRNLRYTTTMGGGYGLARIGFVVYDTRSFLVYPMVGMGAASLDLEVTDHDGGGYKITKASVSRFLTEVSVGLQYGAGGRGKFTQFGLQAGYAFTPTAAWAVSDQTHDTDLGMLPDVGFRGPFVRFTIGFGGIDDK